MNKQKVFRLIAKILPLESVSAHCDVPCGIYDPKSAQIAAFTVLKMVELIEAIPTENPSTEDRAKFMRCVWTKEEHARICKEQILILWTDYFKPQHLTMFPDLHEKFWQTAKLVSENKQHISKESAKKLIAAVNDIADMFAKAKASK